MACCSQSSARHTIQAEVSELKIISVYPLMVSLIASSSSSFVFMQYRRGIFNFFASSTATSCSFIISFCNPQAGYKNLLSLLFTAQKIHHHHSTCNTVVLLHPCIYTLQHIPEDDNFYLFVYRINP